MDQMNGYWEVKTWFSSLNEIPQDNRTDKRIDEIREYNETTMISLETNLLVAKDVSQWGRMASETVWHVDEYAQWSVE